MGKYRTNYYAYLIGGLVGAVMGLVGAYLIEKSPDLEEGENPFNSKKLMRLGLGAVSILWGLMHSGKVQ